MSNPVLARILVVAPATPERTRQRTLFEQAGLAVLEVNDAAEARSLSGNQPDLVLLERWLPDGDGLELLPALKGSGDDFVPVIVCTADDPAARVAALQAGADESVSRPCDGAELLARARALLRLKTTHDRVRAVQRELERLVLSDPLTGLFNRRALFERLAQEFERVGRYQTPMALAMIDLDEFKPVNDQHGHLFGDLVLKGVAEAILKSVRALDIPARYGGDEFALVLPQTDAAGAVRVCERLLRAIGSLRVSAGEAHAQVTVSLGLAFYPAEGISTPEELLRAADDALYRAKRSGRNRFCAVSPVPDTGPVRPAVAGEGLASGAGRR